MHLFCCRHMCRVFPSGVSGLRNEAYTHSHAWWCMQVEEGYVCSGLQPSTCWPANTHLNTAATGVLLIAHHCPTTAACPSLHWSALGGIAFQFDLTLRLDVTSPATWVCHQFAESFVNHMCLGSFECAYMAVSVTCCICRPRLP